MLGTNVLFPRPETGSDALVPSVEAHRCRCGGSSGKSSQWIINHVMLTSTSFYHYQFSNCSLISTGVFISGFSWFYWNLGLKCSNAISLNCFYQYLSFWLLL